MVSPSKARSGGAKCVRVSAAGGSESSKEADDNNSDCVVVEASEDHDSDSELRDLLDCPPHIAKSKQRSVLSVRSGGGGPSAVQSTGKSTQQPRGVSTITSTRRAPGRR